MSAVGVDSLGGYGHESELLLTTISIGGILMWKDKVDMVHGQPFGALRTSLSFLSSEIRQDSKNSPQEDVVHER